MATRRSKRAPEPEVAVPPFYEATQDIYLGEPGSGAMPVAAYRAGDQVHPGVVEAHSLHGAVKVPAVFGGEAEPDESAEESDDQSDSEPDVPEGVTPAEGAAVEIPPDAEALPDAAGKE